MTSITNLALVPYDSEWVFIPIQVPLPALHCGRQFGHWEVKQHLASSVCEVFTVRLSDHCIVYNARVRGVHCFQTLKQ